MCEWITPTRIHCFMSTTRKTLLFIATEKATRAKQWWWIYSVTIWPENILYREKRTENNGKTRQNPRWGIGIWRTFPFLTKLFSIACRNQTNRAHIKTYWTVHNSTASDINIHRKWIFPLLFSPYLPIWKMFLWMSDKLHFVFVCSFFSIVSSRLVCCNVFSFCVIVFGTFSVSPLFCCSQNCSRKFSKLNFFFFLFSFFASRMESFHAIFTILSLVFDRSHAKRNYWQHFIRLLCKAHVEMYN